MENFAYSKMEHPFKWIFSKHWNWKFLYYYFKIGRGPERTSKRAASGPRAVVCTSLIYGKSWDSVKRIGVNWSSREIIVIFMCWIYIISNLEEWLWSQTWNFCTWYLREMNIIVYTEFICCKILQIIHDDVNGPSLSQDLDCDPVNLTCVPQSVYRTKINTYQYSINVWIRYLHVKIQKKIADLKHCKAQKKSLWECKRG